MRDGYSGIKCIVIILHIADKNWNRNVTTPFRQWQKWKILTKLTDCKASEGTWIKNVKIKIILVSGEFSVEVFLDLKRFLFFFGKIYFVRCLPTSYVSRDPHWHQTHCIDSIFQEKLPNTCYHVKYKGNGHLGENKSAMHATSTYHCQCSSTNKQNPPLQENCCHI